MNTKTATLLEIKLMKFLFSFIEESTSVKIPLETIYFVTGVEVRDRTHSCRARERVCERVQCSNANHSLGAVKNIENLVSLLSPGRMQRDLQLN
jgi:hypothetical protein